MEIVAVIPARFASTRLPGKALLSETGRPLILHVIEAARRAKSLQRIIVATDDARIAAGRNRLWRRSHDDPRRPSRPVPIAWPKSPPVSNEPVSSSTFKGTSPRSPVMRSTWSSRCWKRPRCRDSHPGDPNSRRIDLSRPSVRQSRLQPPRAGTLLFAEPDSVSSRRPSRICRCPDPLGHLHLGLYAYRREFLLELGSLPPSPLEAAEKLEQLRVLDAGYPIAVGMVDEPSVGIDTPEDYNDSSRDGGRARVERRRPGHAGDLPYLNGLFSMAYHLRGSY